MLLPFFSLLLIVLTIACADQQNTTRFPDGRMIGGENAVIETYPYQISLEHLGHHYCGGSIIANYYVITAAHCGCYDPKELTIRAGSSLIGEGGSVHHVEKVVLHEKYVINNNGIPVNDLAILKVQEPFQFDDSRQAIKLFDVNEKSKPGTNATITGWGDIGKGKPIQLQTVTIPIIDREVCNKAYEKYGDLPHGQICAAYYGDGSEEGCQGDSGGPLAISQRLAGIVSWGNGCASKNSPGVYTEIGYFRAWINEHAIINT